MELRAMDSDEVEADAQRGHGDPSFTFSKPHFAQVTELPQGLRAAPLALWQALVGPHFVSKTAMLLHTRRIIRRGSPMGQARKV